jgi:hypothetical protein
LDPRTRTHGDEHGLCYHPPGPAGCFDSAHLAEQGVVLETAFSSATPEVRVFGVAIDGIASVRFELDDGSEREAPVQDNAVPLDLAADSVEATWRNPDGSTGRQNTLVIRPDDG